MSHDNTPENNKSERFFHLLQGDLDVRTNRYISHVLGVDASITLSALIMKQQHYHKYGMLTPDGYFYSTLDDLWDITTLKRYVQDKAIELLKSVGLLSTIVRGLPAKRHFKVIFDEEILGDIILRGKEIAQRKRKPERVTKTAISIYHS